MITFKQFLYEMLKPSEYRPLIKGWDKTRLEKIFKASPLNKDRKAYRLYLPLSDDIVPPEIRVALSKALKNKPYILSNQDYIDGKIRFPNSKNEFKIGKVLTKANEQSLLKKFQEDPARKQFLNANEEVTAIISRHPYDIGRMSTRQSWTSCQDLETGNQCHFVPEDIKAGTLVVYIVPNEIINNPAQIDKLSDKSAIGRVLIKPFINIKGQKAYALESKTYKKFTTKWHSAIANWVNTWLNEQTGVSGKFRLHPNVYPDGHKRGTKIFVKTDFDSLNFSDQIEYIFGKTEQEISQLKLSHDFIVKATLHTKDKENFINKIGIKNYTQKMIDELVIKDKTIYNIFAQREQKSNYF
jgi:hypothetical protein